MSYTNFKIELKKARVTEEITLKVLEDRLKKSYYMLNDVTDKVECRKKGDISAWNILNDSRIYIDVKSDSSIHRTNNIWVEESIFRVDNDRFEEGWIYAEYDYIAIISQTAKTIYIVDFKVLQQKYQDVNHKHIEIFMPKEKAYLNAYLINVDTAIFQDIIIEKIIYNEDYKVENIEYMSNDSIFA